MSRFALVMALAAASFPACSFGQVLYGSLTGNVTDSSAAPLPAAKVEVFNASNGVSKQTTTDDRGVYSFNDLQPGVYRISSGSFSTLILKLMSSNAW